MSKYAFDLDEVKRFITAQSSDTSVYLGSDSERFRKDGVWWARYMTVVVVHIDSRHGCRVFGKVEEERDYDAKKNRPRTRLLNEAIKVTTLFQELEDVLIDRHVEVHIDINGKKEHGSNIVMQEAIGYVLGNTGIRPKIKPQAWAASYAADRWNEIRQMKPAKESAEVFINEKVAA